MARLRAAPLIWIGGALAVAACLAVAWAYRGRRVQTDDAAMPDSLVALRRQLDLLVRKHAK